MTLRYELVIPILQIRKMRHREVKWLDHHLTTPRFTPEYFYVNPLHHFPTRPPPTHPSRAPLICFLSNAVFYIQSPLNPTQRLTFWARQKAAMPKGQKQHNMEKTAKPRWSWGSIGERRPPPSQSESLSLDETSYGQETA